MRVAVVLVALVTINQNLYLVPFDNITVGTGGGWCYVSGGMIVGKQWWKSINIPGGTYAGLVVAVAAVLTNAVTGNQHQVVVLLLIQLLALFHQNQQEVWTHPLENGGLAYNGNQIMLVGGGGAGGAGHAPSGGDGGAGGEGTSYMAK